MDTYPLTFSLVGHELWYMINENSLFIDVQKVFRIKLSLNTTSGGEISPNIDTYPRKESHQCSEYIIDSNVTGKSINLKRNCNVFLLLYDMDDIFTNDIIKYQQLIS